MRLQEMLGLRPTRIKLPEARRELLAILPKNARCAEIGVWKGKFSRFILSETDPFLLHLVDPWIFAPEHPSRLYGGKAAQGQADMDTIAEDVATALGYDPRIRLHRNTSTAFFSSYSGDPLDWVYIDGDHSQNAVLADLEGAWRNVRPGGLIAGDDYTWSDADGSLPVKAAVDAFSNAAGATLRIMDNQFVLKRH